MSIEEKRRELYRLEDRVEALKKELETEGKAASWVPSGYYLTYNLLAGAMLGTVGAAASLIFNIVGSLLVGQHPLQLIRVYLTFPLGEAALKMDSGLAMAVGCILYLGTGSLFGIIFHLFQTRFLHAVTFSKQFAAVSLLAVVLWVFNYYAILSWLQPMMFGGSWIVDLVPWWVAALTHLIFAWSMLVLKDWGKFDPTAYITAN